MQKAYSAKITTHNSIRGQSLRIENFRSIRPLMIFASQMPQKNRTILGDSVYMHVPAEWDISFKRFRELIFYVMTPYEIHGTDIIDGTSVGDSVDYDVNWTLYGATLEYNAVNECLLDRPEPVRLDARNLCTFTESALGRIYVHKKHIKLIRSINNE